VRDCKKGCGVLLGYLRDVVDGGFHAAQLGRLNVKHLEHIVGKRVDQVGYAGQGLSGVVLGFL